MTTVRCPTVRLFVVATFLLPFVSACYRPIVTNQGLRPGALETLLDRTEAARGIHTRAPVNVRVIRARELEAIAMEAVHADWTEDELRRYEEALVTIGLWPPGRDLAKEFAATIGTEAVGLYVPDAQTLYVVRDPDIPVSVRIVSALARRDIAREYALAHELVHFLQHQAYPGVFDMVLGMKHSDDAAWAGQAAIEGDAVRYGFAALGSSMRAPSPVDFSRELEKATSQRSFAKQPRILRETIVFPYATGYRLSVLEAALLMESPPASTEQALHLARRHEPFTIFDVPVDTPGCDPVWTDSFGELGISILLRDATPTAPARAWEGWDGDRYVALRCGGTREFAWLTTWDTEHDAREFAAAYESAADTLAARAGLEHPAVAVVIGRDAVVYTPRVEVFAHDLPTTARRRTGRTLADVAASESLTPGRTR